ncbi:MATE family efflux transporter [Exiguobacterium aurantiacum]|uniref:MATE family efflux transporter n=1 Tax=Exiguobacterium aurantiacum TaxID=33987 RepID=A0ABY5FJD8_9BACL|nr:MATE family efflux transporter [Exiguobacterium aurantiacum]UTT41596.1 MATE family efflux transporter [Exiguobacterium aurantiacum]
MVSTKSFWLIAYPLVLAGFSTPLLGVVDTIVIANTGQLTAIGAVAIGAVVFNTLYWLFGFLKISTSGFTAQALGKNDSILVQMSLFRPLVIAFVVGISFLLLLIPIRETAIHLFVTDSSMADSVRTYITTRLYAAPFVLGTYVLLGWLIGHGSVRTALVIQVGGNLLNILLDVWFIHLFENPVAGIALATSLSEVMTFGLGWLFVQGRIMFSSQNARDLMNAGSYITYLTVNRDLFIRTIFLLLMTGWFTSLGARQGVETLSANSILFQLQYLIAYWFSGIGQASTVLTGRAIGQKSKDAYRLTVHIGFRFLIWSTIGITILLSAGQNGIIRIFTENATLRSTIESYYMWILIYPLVAGLAMLYEGIFAGIGDARPVRNSLIYAFTVFAIVIILLVPAIGNHGIWIAFLCFSLTRSISLVMSERRKRIHLFSSSRLS